MLPVRVVPRVCWGTIINNRDALLVVQLSMAILAGQFSAGSCPGYCAEEATGAPLKGQVSTGRAESNVRNDRSHSQDPFSDNGASVPTTSTPVKTTPPKTLPAKTLPPKTAPSRTTPTKATPKTAPITTSSSSSFRPGIKSGGVEKSSIRPINSALGPFYLKGVVAEQKGDLGTALENFVIAINSDPSNRELQGAVHRVELKLKRRYPAFHAYSSYFTDKNDARFLLNYGVRLYSISCFQQAERLFNKAVILDPSNPNGYFNLGVIYEHDGKLSKALSSYEKSVSLFDQHGPDLAASAQQQALSARDMRLKGSISKMGRERRRFSGMEDPKNGRALAQEAVDSVLRQMQGKPSDIPKWPTLGASDKPISRRKVATRHVDVCDHCLILRSVEMWPN